MFVLGIDPGLTTTGYGIIDGGDGVPRPVAVGVIRTERGRSQGARLHELYRDVRAILAEFTPQVAAIEEVFVNRNLRTAVAVGRASGVVMLALTEAGVEVHEYTPSRVKSAVTGYGRAPKEQVQRTVARRLGMGTVPEPPDAADALAVALCHLQMARPEMEVVP